MIKLSTCHFPVSYLMVTLLQINHLLVRVLADFHINSNPFFLVLKPPIGVTLPFFLVGHNWILNCGN